MDNYTELKVDVGVLKTQTTALTSLCEKMDRVIEKIVDQQDRYISQVYEDMEKRRFETERDIKELHERIDTVLEKVEDNRMQLLDELKQLRKEIAAHNKLEEQSLYQLLQWKWMVAGGIVVISWLISHVNVDTIIKTLH